MTNRKNSLKLTCPITTNRELRIIFCYDSGDETQMPKLAASFPRFIRIYGAEG